MHPWGVESIGVGGVPGLGLIAGFELTPGAGLAVVGLLTAPGADPTSAAGLDPIAGLERDGLGLLPDGLVLLPPSGAAATPGQRPHEVWQ